MTRIGVLGGTFDPVHVGHLVAAAEARHALRLDTVLLVVANIPWQKAGDRDMTPVETRFDMVVAAVGDVDGLEASRLEIDRGGESYTADTLAELEKDDPTADLFLVVGRDVANQLDTWKHIDDVRARAGLVVVNRPGAGSWSGAEGWRHGVHHVEIPSLEISGTDLRDRVADGRPIDFLVPAAAVRVIRERGLYAGGG
jgi:nicotinate-nucleotide adenylyltransferase